MTKSNKELARRIKSYRLSRQYTQRQAAAHFQVSPATYIRVEQGKGCSDLTLAKIEKILSVATVAA